MADPSTIDDREGLRIPRRLGLWLERHRLGVQITLDVIAWAISLPVMMVFRYEFELDPHHWGPFDLGGLTAIIVLAAVLQVCTGLVSGLYLGRWRYGTFDEVAHVARTAAITTTVLALTNVFVFDYLAPTSVVLAGGLLALVLMTTVRYSWRLVLERSRRPSRQRSRPALVFGAGEGGAELVTSILRNPDSPYLPVALVDDDPTKRHLRIKGVSVMGDRTSIGRLATELKADLLIIAVPSAAGELLRELSNIALEANLEVKALPRLDELLGSGVGVSDVRSINEQDLLGRHVVDIDVDSIAGYLTDHRVMVTGAGGSIGSELSVQIARFAPSQLVLLDRDESALHAVQMRIEGRALLDSRNLVIADLREPARLREVFEEHKPEVIFHAAALKHLPMLEMYPGEAVKTNIIGTQNVLDVAAEHGVQRFVNISTDKAADPISVLGYTKRIAERLTARTATQTPGTFLSVRFGNVLGSRGSVLTSFRAQIDAGGPLTVTDRDVTRYFMTVEEAVQLVIQAGAVGVDAEALVLDMGEPVRIDDVARRLVAQAPRAITINYTGLRPGEKLHEVLLGQGEIDRRTIHPLISHVEVPPLDYATVLSTLDGADDRALVDRLADLTRFGLTDVQPSEPASAQRLGDS